MAAVRLIDFEAAMRGEREYAFTVVGCPAADGDSRFLTRTLTASGYRRDQLGADLRRRLLAWGIMHRYSNLTWWMRRLPERRRAVAIYGPTSSGKTALSLDGYEAASERGLRPVVLNADSRHVYVGMDIGTSKIKPQLPELILPEHCTLLVEQRVQIGVLDRPQRDNRHVLVSILRWTSAKRSSPAIQQRPSVGSDE